MINKIDKEKRVLGMYWEKNDEMPRVGKITVYIRKDQHGESLGLATPDGTLLCVPLELITDMVRMVK